LLEIGSLEISRMVIEISCLEIGYLIKLQLPISIFHRLWRERAIGGAKLPISIVGNIVNVVKLYH